MGAASPKRPKREVKALLQQARRAERTVEICLRGDLRDQMAEIEDQIMRLEAEAKHGNSLAGNPEAVALARRQQALNEQVKENTLTFRLRGVSQRRWTELVAQHPPREDNQKDLVMGYNLDDLVEALARECTVEPELDADDWDHLLGEALTDAQWDVLSNAVWAVNQRDVDVPFSLAASRILQNSERESRQPDASE